MKRAGTAAVDRPAAQVRFVFAGGAVGGDVMLVTVTDREVRRRIVEAPCRARAARQTRQRTGRVPRVRVNVPARGSRRGAARATAEASAGDEGGGADGEPPPCAQAEFAEPELAEDQTGPTEEHDQEADQILSYLADLICESVVRDRERRAFRSLDDAAAVLPVDVFVDLAERSSIHEEGAGMDRDTADRMTLSAYVRKGRV